VAARPSTAFSFLGPAALLFLPAVALAEDPPADKPAEATATVETPAVATPPLSGSAAFGISWETSKFTQVRIGDAPAILIPGDAVKRTEPFRHFTGQLNGNVPCPGISGLTCVADLYYDTNYGLETSDVDTVIAQGGAGVQYAMGTSVYGVKLAKDRWKVGGQEFRRIEGGSVDWVSALTEELSSYVLLTAQRYRHPGDQSALDADYRAITGNLRYGTKDRWESAYTVQATFSRESNLGGDPALDNQTILTRIAWDAKPADGWEAGIAWLFQRARFGAFDPTLGVRRDDRYNGFDFQVSRRLTRDVYLRLDVGFAAYRSSAEAFDNDWRSFGFAVNWKF